MAKKFNEEDGVWRTIGGRKVFIRNGQSMSEAMKESGKFKKGNKEEIKEEIKEETKEDTKEEIKEEKIDKEKDIDKEEEEKGKKINETMDKRQEIIKKLDDETKELSDYDKYNLAVSKLEDTEGMQPTEKQYWVGVKEDYQKNALGKQMKNEEKDDSKKSYDNYVKETLSNEDYIRENRPNEHLNNLINESKEKRESQLKEQDEYELYKKAKENPDSIDPMTENSTDWETLDKKYKDKYEKESNPSDDNKGENTNYKNKINDVAKNSKEDNVTLDIETGEPVSFEKGYSVSFQQSTDAYDDNEYYDKVEECRNKCDGKVYAGKYGGDAEVSFHTDNLDDAKEIMYKYNQESIWDWEHETLIMNDKYDSSKNQTNYKEEKTTNEIMNDAIREKAGKGKVKEDLPQKTEIKNQGTSNRKEVSENIQAHILDYYDSPEDFIQQMDNMNAPTMWHAGEQLAKGGSYMIYYDEQREFLDSLKINPSGKRFNDDKVFNTYTSLVGRESAKLYDRLQRNAYKKYLKEHPGSEMSLTEFKNMRKGE